MTTFKHFTIESTFASRRNLRIMIGVLIFSFFSNANIYSQSNYEKELKESYKYSHSEKSSNEVSIPALHLSLKSETSEQIFSSESDDSDNLWIDDLIVDQERSDGIDMFLSGTNYRASFKIICEIEFLQEGHTVLQVFDAFSGELLKSVFEGPTKKGTQKFEIDQKEFSVKSILIVATHKANSGQMLTSNLQFDISRTEDLPLSINGLDVSDFNAKLTPTLGRGMFQISANFKTNGHASVKVYDLTGTLVETLYAGNIQEGAVSFEGNSSNWIAGNYIVCIHTDKGSWVRKMIVH